MAEELDISMPIFQVGSAENSESFIECVYATKATVERLSKPIVVFLRADCPSWFDLRLRYSACALIAKPILNYWHVQKDLIITSRSTRGREVHAEVLAREGSW